LNELTSSLTLTSGVQAAAGDKSLVDSLEGIVVWKYDAGGLPPDDHQALPRHDEGIC
jgi:hypothetical protein